jgi:hypothetical protein
MGTSPSSPARLASSRAIRMKSASSLLKGRRSMAGSPISCRKMGMDRKGKARIRNPFEKIQFLYIMFQPFVKAPSIADCGFPIPDFICLFFLSIRNPQSKSLALTPFFC